MKQNNLKKQQETLRNKFLKKGVKMISPETIFFLMIPRLVKTLQ